MRINNMLNSTSIMPIVLGFDGEGGGEGGGAPAASAPEPSLMGGPAEGGSDAGDGGDGGSDGDASASAGGSDDGASGDASNADGDGKEDGDGAEGEDGGEGDPEEGEEGQSEGSQDGAPEEYDFSSIFEGEDAPQLNEETLKEFTSLLKEDNLTQEQANRYMGMAQKLQQQWLNEVTQHHVNTRADWRQQAQVDAEFGGDKFKENLALAKQARDEFGSENLGKLLDETGLGDHPEVIRFFVNVGKANSEHGFAKPGKPSTQKSFYDHPTSKGRKK